MESLKNVASGAGDKQRRERRPLSAYQQYVISSILPDVELQYNRMQTEKKKLKTENETLKNRLKVLTTESEHLKTEQQRLSGVSKNRDQLRNQLVQCKNEVLVLGKTVRIQKTELRREHQQNEVLKQEVESMKKELQSARQQVVTQRAEQQNLREQLEQVVKERDGLNEKWLHCRHENSELQDKIATRQSNLSKKDSQCKEQMRQIHLLKLEKDKLEKQRDFLGKEAEEHNRHLRKCEEEIYMQREKLRDSIPCYFLKNQMVKRTDLLEQKPPVVKKPSQDGPHQKIEFLQKQLLDQTKELTRTQKLREELKQKLTQLSFQFQRCRVAARDQKEKFKAMTAERNAYRSDNEKMRKELAAIKKEKLAEKLKNLVAKKTKKIKLSSGVKSSQSNVSLLSSNKSNVPTTSREVQMDSTLKIRGLKIESESFI
ncbi:chromosome partition protein Smc-like [Amphiprion ocellaris]|uniref:chromosome partition protein Smc-like n=1 Tax=Amphiprion ocellaris TaxID=80972 RepID=UPI002410FCD2|nr:chromosome partition protein Smc-like [Amphiprion ocellaris]